MRTKMVAQNRYCVAIIGLGSLGQNTWFESLQNMPKVSVCAVCDSNAAVIDGFALRHAETPAYMKLERLLEHHFPDFAIVCVPNRYHLPIIKQLEAVGVSCLKEKPIATTVDEFHQLCSAQTKIGVTFQRRWQPRYVHFRHLLPEIGKPLSVRATIAGKYDPPQYGWRVRDNVGTFDDLGVHMLDILVWLFGRPSSVFARCLSDDQPCTRDRESHVFMTWQKSELVGHLYVSEVALEKEEWLVVRGTLGSLHLKSKEITHYDVGGRQTYQMGFQSLKQDDIFLTTEAIRLSFASQTLEQVAQPHQDVGRQNGTTKTLDRDERHFNNSHLVTMPSNGHAEFAAAPAAAADNGYDSDQSVPKFNSVTQKTFLLNNEYAMPGLGFGTRKPKKPKETYEAVKKALEVGYRHIDTAYRYNNEGYHDKA
ncbi:hypothetical protein QQS21_006474 [Conoideocrella luteorostrata]|uniref:Oxidoreductase n=1 Tax=Conoideocrella luteorostrata TaxID=1105319 RepID=A0AAJ0FXZ5_9HYPO|nr:hypothetical protein QQS21_006474 [Conoideocrella luteorostrata]